jgi:hypothetical protein
MSLWIVCKWRTRLNLGNITIIRSCIALYRSFTSKRAKGLYIKVVLLLKASKGEVVRRPQSFHVLNSMVTCADPRQNCGFQVANFGFIHSNDALASQCPPPRTTTTTQSSNRTTAGALPLALHPLLLRCSTTSSHHPSTADRQLRSLPPHP